MKVSELIDILKQYDPSDDVAVATQHDEAYFNFIVKEHKGRGVTKGRSSVVALAVTDEACQYFLAVEA